MEKGVVVQNWLTELPWKMQSVVISAQRGPDTAYCPNIKKITKWMRSVCQENADPSHSFMEKVELPKWGDIEKELEYSTAHFVSHFMFGLEIIGYKHPDIDIAVYALRTYHNICSELFHSYPENEYQMDKRLEDKI